eukprot:8547505-Pyramimonas_sp.AAC.1
MPLSTISSVLLLSVPSPVRCPISLQNITHGLGASMCLAISGHTPPASKCYPPSLCTISSLPLITL